jgi:hypothetical protein
MDFAVFFPQLVAVRIVEFPAKTNARRHTSRLEVFRPLSLDNIHHLYEGDCRISSAQDPCYQNYVCIYNILDDLDEVDFREGACLVGPTVQNCRHFEENWKRQSWGNPPEDTLTVSISSEEPDENTEATIRLIFELLTLSTRPDRRQPLLGYSLKRRLTVTLERSVFSTFVRLVSQ